MTKENVSPVFMRLDWTICTRNSILPRIQSLLYSIPALITIYVYHSPFHGYGNESIGPMKRQRAPKSNKHLVIIIVILKWFNNAHLQITNG